MNSPNSCLLRIAPGMRNGRLYNTPMFLKTQILKSTPFN